MYTVSIAILIVMAALAICENYKLFRSKAFLFWIVTACAIGWSEFFLFLRHYAWQFSDAHIMGLKIYGVTIEDILFCPCFAILFFRLYHFTKLRFTQRIFNPIDKLVFALTVSIIALVYYDIGSQFAKYMTVRILIGFIGLIYCWNNSSFRHSMLFLIIVFCIGFGWDLPAVINKWWYYIDNNNNVPKVYDGYYLTILNAKFPIELFGYYLTGGFLSFWLIAFYENYFLKTKRKGLTYETFQNNQEGNGTGNSNTNYYFYCQDNK